MGHGRELNFKQRSLFISGYRPELDTSLELDKENMCYFQDLIGILRWAVDMGRSNVAVDVSILSINLTALLSGNLYQPFKLFVYLKYQPKSKFVMNP